MSGLDKMKSRISRRQSSSAAELLDQAKKMRKDRERCG